MAHDSKVVWHEGMFLRAHHFQQSERYLERLVRGRVAGLRPHSWGILELTVNRELLKTGKFALAACRGIMEDGTPFDIPDTDAPPLPFDVPETVRNAVVYLTLPVRQPGGIEVADGAADGAIARYVAEDFEAVDGNTSSSAVASIRIGRLRLGFTLDGRDRTGYHCLGLARILEVRADRSVILDERYIPPVLDCAAAPALSGFLNEVQGLLHHRAEALASRVGGGGGTSGVSGVADILMLQAINRTEPLLAYLAQASQVHPESVYMLAVQLAGELATFTARTRRPPSFPPYRHTDLERTFAPIKLELRQALSVVLEQAAVTIPLAERKFGIRVGVIEDRSLIGTASFVLAVRADVPAEALRRGFPSQVKIGPVEQIRELINVALPGIRVKPLPVAPRQIPFVVGSTYFELDPASPVWKQLATSGGIALHIAGEFPGIALELWAIRDNRP